MTRALLYTLVAAVLWGTSFPVITVGLDRAGAGPFAFAFARFFLAALAVTVLSLLLRRYDTRWFRSPFVWAIALINAAGYALQFLAQDRTSASKTSLLVDIDVLAIAVLSYVFLKERHGRGLLVALGLGAIGLVLLTTGGDPSAATLRREEFVGDALAFLAGLVWALYFVGMKAYLDRRPTIDGLAILAPILSLTALFLAPFAWVEGFASVLTPVGVTATLYLALGPTAIAFFLWQEALRSQGVTHTSVLLLLEVVVAVAIGVLALDERLSAGATVGAVLILAAVVLTARAAPAIPTTPPPARAHVAGERL